MKKDAVQRFSFNIKKCFLEVSITDRRLLLRIQHFISGWNAFTVDREFFKHWFQRFYSGSKVLNIGSNVFTTDPKF